MNLRRLTYFVEVARERHFSRAAERLHVAQPALSQQVRALEKELGVTLLARSTRRVELTPAGERLLELGDRLLTDVEALEDEVRAVAAGRDGTVRIGFIGSATYELMPRLSRALLADVPKLRVDLRGEMLSPDILAELEGRSLDVGLLRPFPETPGVTWRTLREEPLVVALPSDHPAAADSAIRLADLAESSFVSYPLGGSAVGVTFVEACAAVGFRPTVRVEVRQTSALVSFVAAGLGVAVVPGSVREVRIPGVRYLRLADVDRSVALRVAWRDDPMAPVVDQVLERLPWPL